MGCQCKERAAALARAAQAMRTGDTATLKKELAFVPTSMAQDAVSTVRIQTNAARARLSALTSRRNR